MLKATNSQIQKKITLVIVGNLLLNNGFETSFVAGVLGNVNHEGEIGIFEYNPTYLKTMEDKLNYKNKYSGKNITEVNLKELSSLVDNLSQKEWKEEKFGLGCIQWTGVRTKTLVQLYNEECGNNETINLTQAISAESKMIMNELSGNYKYVYDDWKKENESKIDTEEAAYNAASEICLKYEIPYDKINKAKERGETAKIIYNIMTQ